MARLWTAGAEIGVGQGAWDGEESGAVTRDTGNARSGAAAYKCDSGAGATTFFIIPVNGSTAISVTSFYRMYFKTTDTPASQTNILALSAFNNDGSAAMTTSGTIVLMVGGVQQGSASVAANDGSWHRLEMKVTINGSTQATAMEVLLDGTSVATWSGTRAINLAGPRMGWVGNPGASKVMYVDDCAANNSSGATQNSYPGDGKVVLLKPISDNARGTGWVNDANGATNFFAATDNIPPAGIADTTGSTGAHQIRNGTANANSSVDLNLESYTTAGIGGSDTINVLQPIVNTSAPVSTGAKAGTIGVVSNPTIANVSLAASGTSGAFWGGVAAGTWSTGWLKWSAGTATYAPSVTLGTSPVIRITQVTSSTRIAMVDFIGMYVEYTPAGGPANTPQSMPASLTLGAAMTLTKNAPRVLSVSEAMTLVLAAQKKAPRTVAASMTLTPSVVVAKSYPRSIGAGLTLTAAIAVAKSYPRSLAATLTETPVISRVMKALRTVAASETLTPAISRVMVAPRTLAASETLTPALARVAKFPRSLASGLTLTAAISVARAYARSIPATLSLTGALVKQENRPKTLAASETLTPVLTRQMKASRTLAASETLTPQVSLFSKFYRTIAAGLTLTASLQGGKTYPRTIPATLTLTAAESHIKKAPRSIDASLTLSPAITKVSLFRRALAAALTLSPSLATAKRYYRTLAATETLTPSLQGGKTYPRALAATLTLTASITKLFKGQRTLAVTETLTPTLTKQSKSYRTLAVTETLTPAITKSSRSYRAIAAGVVLSPALTLRKMAPRTLAASLTMTSLISRIRRTAVQIDATETLTASMSRRRLLTLAANLPLLGSLDRGNQNVPIDLEANLTLTPSLTWSKLFHLLPYRTGYVLSHGTGRIIHSISGGIARIEKSRAGRIISRGGKV